MRMLRVNMKTSSVAYEPFPEEWQLLGGRGLIAKIMNSETPPACDPMGPENKLIICGGPLAGTLAPQLGRISIGGKSPLTLGVKEANSGGPAAQKLDKLDIRAIVVEGAPKDGSIYCLEISKDGARLASAEEYRGMKNYDLAKVLRAKHGSKASIISIGIGGERKAKGASVSLTDILGDPSRNAGRGGLGAVMGSKGLKAIVIDDAHAPPVPIQNKSLFDRTVKSWIDTLRGDLSCQLFSTFGTPLAVASNSCQGTMPARNYSSGRPEGFKGLTGEAIKRNVWERGGKYHACMTGCVVQCSIIYNDVNGKRLASAYEYEALAMLGTNLGIADPDAVARLKFACDDLGLDLVEMGSSFGVAASVGKMEMGNAESAAALFEEIERGTPLGEALANGVVATAAFLGVKRVPAIKGQAIPGHDPRTVKGTGVTYVTSPMGADHTAGLTYKSPLRKSGQVKNSLRSQIKAAVCDAMGYCINALPGGQASFYGFLRDLLNARFGASLTEDDVIAVGKETLKDELKFNEAAEFFKSPKPEAGFIRDEVLAPSHSTFDVEQSEVNRIWDGLETYREPRKFWEIRFPRLPDVLFGNGVLHATGERLAKVPMKKALFICDPIMRTLGYADTVRKTCEKCGIETVLFSEVQSDPPIEEIEETGRIFRKEACDGIVALGGGSSMDAAKATCLRVSQPGVLEEYGSMVGGAGKIKAPIPPLVCIPTTSGTGSEVNSYAVITDREKNQKFVIMSDLLVPSLAVIDPEIASSMPAGLTAQTGVDALAHCVEGFVGMSIPYHPYYEALGLYGARLIGRSLRKAVSDGNDLEARSDMSMAAIYGGICFTKGLGLGHAIGHVLGALAHLPHGIAVSVSLLCFVRHNQKACQRAFADLAYALDQSDDLESALTRLYQDIGMPTRFRDMGIEEADLKKIAFETSMDVANMVGNPIPPKESHIRELLKAFY